MFGRTRSTIAKENAAAAAQLAAELARDKKFRRQLLAGARHGARANRRARRQVGLVALANRLAADRTLRRELTGMVEDLQRAWRRVERKRSHRLRTSLLVAAGTATAAAAAAPQVRRWLTARASDLAGERQFGPRRISESIEVDVPVSTAYNQWTQFEDFPLFMEGVDDVRQLDDTRLHWAATVAGRRAEWDAKILEQHRDRQISWISEDGKKTRGTVNFEPLGPSRTLVSVSMSYQSAGIGEAIGSAAGLDSRRVRGDLERFKQLIESHGNETGAWPGEISAGTAQR